MISLPTTYTTVGEDMWDKISLYFYNTEFLSDQLQYANPQYAGVWVFDAGCVLTIPYINIQNVIPSPPWVTIWKG